MFIYFLFDPSITMGGILEACAHCDNRLQMSNEILVTDTLIACTLKSLVNKCLCWVWPAVEYFNDISLGFFVIVFSCLALSFHFIRWWIFYVYVRLVNEPLLNTFCLDFLFHFSSFFFLGIFLLLLIVWLWLFFNLGFLCVWQTEYAQINGFYDGTMINWKAIKVVGCGKNVFVCVCVLNRSS